MMEFNFPTLPAKINTASLQQEIALVSNVSPSLVGLSIYPGGSRTVIANERTTIETLPPVITVIIPDDTSIQRSQIEAAIRAHAPEYDDAEAIAAANQKEEDDRIANHPIVKALQAQVDAIANVEVVRTELALASSEETQTATTSPGTTDNPNP
jgi:hypothetical protein